MITMGDIRPINLLLILAVLKILPPSQSELAVLVLRRIALLLREVVFGSFKVKML